jgi:hypothetical protein
MSNNTNINDDNQTDDPISQMYYRISSLLCAYERGERKDVSQSLINKAYDLCEGVELAMSTRVISDFPDSKDWEYWMINATQLLKQAQL